jgi:hypothetical protein
MFCLMGLIATPHIAESRAAATCTMGDANHDNHITSDDYTTWRNAYNQGVRTPAAGSTCVIGDTNQDGHVKLNDFVTWRSAYNQINTASAQGATDSVKSYGQLFGFSSSSLEQMDDMKKWGAKALRIEFTWYKHEPNPPVQGKHTYAHSQDNLIKEANNRGFKVLGMPDYTPKWVADPGCFAKYGTMCGPREEFAADFGEYVGMLVERFDADGINDAPGSPRIDAWEIWNEPNLADFWRPQPDARIYVKYLKAAYAQAKAADPDTIIVTGGLCCYMLGANAPLNYLKSMYAAGAKGHFDALGMHPYTYPAMPSQDNRNNVWQQMSKAYAQNGQPDSIRGIMEKNGDGAKQIWQTEMGAPTGGDTNGDGKSKCDNGDGATTGDEDRCVTEEQQKTMLVEAYTLWKTYPWAGPFFWYSHRDGATGKLNTELNYGVVRSDNSPKPAALAIPAITQ